MKNRKFIFILLLTILSIVLFPHSVKARGINLEDIVEKFNNSNSVKQMKEAGYELVAAIDEEEPNILSVTMEDSENESMSVNYELDGNILKNEQLELSQLLTVNLVANSIGILHGYDDGEIYNTLNSKKIRDYTIENEGFEVKENGSYYSVKMDITKKVPLVDLSDFYLEMDDFDILKNIIEDGENGNQTGKNLKMAYNVEVHDDESYIYMGEEPETTESTYKSILSALEVMYGKEVVEYFESIYPEFDDGISVLEGFTIETEVDMDLEEHPIFEGSKVVLVTIDNKYINDTFLRKEYIGETINRGDKTISLDFTNNNSYKLGFFDSASSSDATFFFKYILEPLFDGEDVELVDDNTAYFNIVDGKIVIGDKDNSLFKIVIFDDYLEISSTENDLEKNNTTLRFNGVKSKEYDECNYGHEHFRYGEYNVTLNIVYVKEVYKVLEGAGQTFNTLDNKELTFRFDIEYAKFISNGKVYIDGNLVDSSNYTVKEGSTIITFNNNYVKKLSNQEHTLKVAVVDGEVSTNFTVTGNPINNPQTGDNIISYIILFGLSIMGLTGLGIYSRKKRLFN